MPPVRLQSTTATTTPRPCERGRDEGQQRAQVQDKQPDTRALAVRRNAEGYRGVAVCQLQKKSRLCEAAAKEASSSQQGETRGVGLFVRSLSYAFEQEHRRWPCPTGRVYP